MTTEAASSTRVISDRSPGDTNIEAYGFDVHPQVFPLSGAVIIAFIAITLGMEATNPGSAQGMLQGLRDGISEMFGWFYILAANLYLIFVGWLAFSRFGNIRIGGPDATPEFSTSAWAAMLISAGMGIGIMFWGVAEPIFHFEAPPIIFDAEPSSSAAAQVAMGVTFFHWGLHAWGIYAIVALSLAFFAFNWGLPLTIRSVFYPIFGENIYGWWGHIIDVLAVVATLFGLATSLGLGAQQVNSGLSFLFGIPDNTTVQITIIAVITCFATISVVRGLEGGVKVLSEANMVIAAVFMIFVFMVGPTLFILDALISNIGWYIQNLPRMSLWTETYETGTYEGGGWQNAWTVFYWGWWISWSPFVGMFIARVSNGRTVREFILGVLFLPSILTAMWMTVFGATALNMQLTGVGSISEAVNSNVSTAMFVMLQNLPLTAITSFISVILITIFFVTSSDSGSLVVDSLTAGGKLDAPVPQRVFWAVTEGLVGAVLLVGGGLQALQAAAISAGLPLAFVLLIMCYSLYKGLEEEYLEQEATESEKQSFTTAAVAK